MKQLIKYAHKRFHRVNYNLKKYRKQAKPEQLHQVRVELKKIRTLFNLLTFSSGKFHYSLSYKPLKYIFKKAGHIREWDVLQQLFEHYKLEEFEENIFPSKKDRKQEIAKFHKKTKRYKLTIKRSYEKAKDYFIKINKQDLKNYISFTECQINRRLSRKFKQNELHPIRKQIKELMYLLRILPSKNIQKKIRMYDGIQNIIGLWHDKDVLITLFKKNQNNLHNAIVRKLQHGRTTDLKTIKSKIKLLELE